MSVVKRSSSTGRSVGQGAGPAAAQSGAAQPPGGSRAQGPYLGRLRQHAIRACSHARRLHLLRHHHAACGRLCLLLRRCKAEGGGRLAATKQAGAAKGGRACGAKQAGATGTKGRSGRSTKGRRAGSAEAKSGGGLLGGRVGRGDGRSVSTQYVSVAGRPPLEVNARC